MTVARWYSTPSNVPKISPQTSPQNLPHQARGPAGRLAGGEADLGFKKSPTQTISFTFLGRLRGLGSIRSAAVLTAFRYVSDYYFTFCPYRNETIWYVDGSTPATDPRI